jgi:hypothetical protein
MCLTEPVCSIQQSRIESSSHEARKERFIIEIPQQRNKSASLPTEIALAGVYNIFTHYTQHTKHSNAKHQTHDLYNYTLTP